MFSLFQELVNGLVLDKRKRDEDDESPELKKVKLDPRLACLLQVLDSAAASSWPARAPAPLDARLDLRAYLFCRHFAIFNRIFL